MSREFPESLGEGLGERPTFKPGDRVVWTFSDIDFSGTVLEVEADGEFATVDSATARSSTPGSATSAECRSHNLERVFKLPQRVGQL